MNGIASDSTTGSVIVGVDTHKHIHVAVALDANGVRLAERAVSADSGGYAQIEAWARALGRVRCFGIEGTGSYGAGLAGFLRRGGHRVVEVNRGDRRARRNNGKSDSGDAEAAARAVLSGQASAVPKSADGVVEMIRQLKVARDTARKAKTAAIVTLKAMVINAPAPLRESVDGLGDKALIKRCAAYRPGSIDTPTAAAKHARRALARRWVALDAEVAAMTANSTGSPHRPRLACATASASEPTPPPNCSSSSATTPNGSAQRPHSRNSAEPAPSPPHPGRPTGTASTAAGTAKPTQRSTGSSSSACASTSPPSTTSPAAAPKASPRKTSSAASNASSPARPTTAS